MITDLSGPRPGNAPHMTELSREYRTGAISLENREETAPVKDMGMDRTMKSTMVPR
eukprot:CAMPEP_0194576188 /NCGR_PEP_ID=MMETSP0292-20121207/11392_1 /TAXON_ID=39354 /ORGANISM="Heterosigma akashiwo, Strain CCMP2393" /LENGTH=55 /DNA_ID=CAMNT_0039428165 /DNA_START=423 /DNA_END=591 /DNA_ORIENTATION=-